MGFEPTTFYLARRRSTTELHPLTTIGTQDRDRGILYLYHLSPSNHTRWTRSDSNRRSPACKAGAFPLGHGPEPPCPPDFVVPTRGLEPPRPCGQQILSLQRLPIPPRRQPNPGRAVSDWPYPRFCSSRHLSHRAYCPMAAPSLQGVTLPRRRRCGETEPACASPAHSPCSRPHARLAGGITANRWWALTPPFHPLPGIAGRDCFLLRLWSPGDYSPGAPTYCFVGRPSRSNRVGVGKFL